MSMDGYIGSHYSFLFYLQFLPIDTLQRFNTVLFQDVNVINASMNNIVKWEFSSLVLSVLPFMFL